jgi:hypothetical protein
MKIDRESKGPGGHRSAKDCDACTLAAFTEAVLAGDAPSKPSQTVDGWPVQMHHAPGVFRY